LAPLATAVDGGAISSFFLLCRMTHSTTAATATIQTINAATAIPMAVDDAIDVIVLLLACMMVVNVFMTELEVIAEYDDDNVDDVDDDDDDVVVDDQGNEFNQDYSFPKSVN